MRSFVVFAACLALAAADIGLKLRQAAEARASSSYDVGQQSVVSLDYAPTIYQDTVAGAGATDTELARSGFGGASAAAGASAGATAYGGGAAATGTFGRSNADYQAGYEAGLRAGASAGASAGATDTRFGGFGGAFSGASAGASATATAAAAAKTNVRYAAPVIQKHFYYHAAPEEPQAAAEADSLTITPRKHYKVIFIKAPTVSANAGAASRAASQTEEKTIVYVLVNKPAQANAGAVADASSFSSGKPEVYFIKYQGKDAAQAIANAQANSFAGADAGAASFADAGAASYADSGAFGGPLGFGGAGTLSGAGASANTASLAGSYGQYEVRSDALSGAGAGEFASGVGGASATANAAAATATSVVGTAANDLQDTVVY